MLSASGSCVSMPVPMRSSGTRPMPSAWARCGSRRSTRLPSTSIGPDDGRQHAGDDVGQLALAIAGHAGDADDLAGAQRQAKILQAAPLAAGGRDRRRAAAAAGRACAGGRCGGVELAAAHQLGELALVTVGVIGALGDAAALAHDHDPAGDGAHLAELVADEDDAHALAPPWRGARVEQPLGLARRQRRRRLVEDQDAGAADQRP